MSIDERKQFRGSYITGSGVPIDGVIAGGAEMCRTKDRDLDCLERLAEAGNAGSGAPVDYFAYRKPHWQSIGRYRRLRDRGAESMLTILMGTALAGAWGRMSFKRPMSAGRHR